MISGNESSLDVGTFADLLIVASVVRTLSAKAGVSVASIISIPDSLPSK
jgi:hypothetical protein